MDKNARFPRRPVVLEKHTYYGELQYLFVVRLRPSTRLNLTEHTTIVLAAIRTCSIEETHGTLDIQYYSKEGRLDVVDVSCVQCLVGRIRNGARWAVIDRSGNLARAVYVDDSE